MGAIPFSFNNDVILPYKHIYIVNVNKDWEQWYWRGDRQTCAWWKALAVLTRFGTPLASGFSLISFFFPLFSGWCLLYLPFTGITIDKMQHSDNMVWKNLCPYGNQRGKTSSRLTDLDFCNIEFMISFWFIVKKTISVRENWI